MTHQSRSAIEFLREPILDQLKIIADQFNLSESEQIYELEMTAGMIAAAQPGVEAAATTALWRVRATNLLRQVHELEQDADARQSQHAQRVRDLRLRAEQARNDLAAAALLLGCNADELLPVLRRLVKSAGPIVMAAIAETRDEQVAAVYQQQVEEVAPDAV